MANKIKQISQEYSENLTNTFCQFDTAHNWTVESGTGSGEHSTDFYYAGARSLKITNSDVQNSALTINSGSESTSFTTPYTGKYIYSWYLRNNSVGNTKQVVSGSIEIFQGASLLSSQAFTIGETDDEFDVWLRFATIQNIAASQDMTFKVKIDQDATSTLTSVTLYLDGFMVNLDDRNMLFPPTYKTPL